MSCFLRQEWFTNQLSKSILPTEAALNAAFAKNHDCVFLRDMYDSYYPDAPTASEWTFDVLEAAPVITRLQRMSSLEQSLENRLMQAVGSSTGNMQAIVVDMMARFARLEPNGTALVSSMPDVGPWNSLPKGGKAGGASSLLNSPNVDAAAADRFGSLWAAMKSLQGNQIEHPEDIFEFVERLPTSAKLPAFTSADVSFVEIKSCSPSCVNGACVKGSCK